MKDLVNKLAIRVTPSCLSFLPSPSVGVRDDGREEGSFIELRVRFFSGRRPETPRFHIHGAAAMRCPSRSGGSTGCLPSNLSTFVLTLREMGNRAELWAQPSPILY